VIPVRAVVHGQSASPFGCKNDRSPDRPARCHNAPVGARQKISR
jgi:hypothetical protein